MKYMALIYMAEGREPTPDSAEFGPWMARWQEVTKIFEDAGVMRGGDPLEPTATATSVRVRGGKTETMDGPFAETKEQLGGYYILDCAHLDEAIKYASMLPAAELGTVEIRPIMDYSE
ncbi:MAG: YciI family protein [Pseudomonadota bacterium]